jgi:hypothetical protein
MQGSKLHDLMHRLPGVPAHVDAAVQERHQHARPRGQSVRARPHPRARLTNPTHHHDRSPRVLVRWQGWIARVFRFGR